MAVKIQAIFDEDSWRVYVQSFPVMTSEHYPAVAPSFPVLVVSELCEQGQQVDGDFHYQPNFVMHSFLEQSDLKRLLGPWRQTANPNTE
jgi:hypothetical protein